MATENSKRDKKEKRSETGGVRKSKKDREKRKHVTAEGIALPAVFPLIQAEGKTSQRVGVQDQVGDPSAVKVAPPLGALVPFANPMADDKVGRKVLKGVKKG